MRIRTIKFLFYIYLFLGITTAHADYRGAISALNNNKIEVAISELENLAKKGDGKAMSLLAYMYLTGNPVNVDKRKGTKLLYLAIKKHEMSAKFILGLSEISDPHFSNRPIESRINRALSLIENAALNDFIPAQIFLAKSYTLKSFLAPDPGKASRLFKKAAELGSKEARAWSLVLPFLKEKSFQPDEQLYTTLATHTYEGIDVAYYGLGMLALQGIGTKANAHGALEWFYIARHLSELTFLTEKANQQISSLEKSLEESVAIKAQESAKNFILDTSNDGGGGILYQAGEWCRYSGNETLQCFISASADHKTCTLFEVFGEDIVSNISSDFYRVCRSKELKN